MSRFSVVLVVTILLSGCAYYKVGAVFEEGGQPFYGSATVPVGGFGTMEAVSEDGTVKCTGKTAVTKRPVFAKTGAQGYAEGTCDDGRTFKIDFIQTTESGGYGTGLDGEGNIIRMQFDSSETLVRSRLRNERLRMLTN